MPISYCFDKSTAILQSKFSGIIVFSELVEYLNSVVADQTIGSQFVELVDMQGAVDLQVYFSELHPLGALWQRYIDKGCLATVLVAPTDLSFGIARMIKSVIEDSEAGNRGAFVVVKSMAEAISDANRFLEAE